MSETKPPLPPFTRETAAQKVQAAEDAWNTCDPKRVAQAYTLDSVWRNRDVFVTGRDEITAFLTQKWERELDYAPRVSYEEAMAETEHYLAQIGMIKH